MIIKQIIEEDFINYKKPSMVIAFPTCSFKCDKENGCNLCQNSSLVKDADIIISYEDLFERYNLNPITKAIVMQGLEPFDSWEDVYGVIKYFRNNGCNDDVVIYTGYYKNEIQDKIEMLKVFKNIIIKFGRYRPNQKRHYDSILGINLANDEQYAEVIN